MFEHHIIYIFININVKYIFCVNLKYFKSTSPKFEYISFQNNKCRTIFNGYKKNYTIDF